jgi:hypothetical protein
MRLRAISRLAATVATMGLMVPPSAVYAAPRHAAATDNSLVHALYKDASQPVGRVSTIFSSG